MNLLGNLDCLERASYEAYGHARGARGDSYVHQVAAFDIVSIIPLPTLPHLMQISEAGVVDAEIDRLNKTDTK